MLTALPPHLPYPSAGDSTKMLAERRSSPSPSPSPSPSRGISIGGKISAIGARLSRKLSNAGDSQQNQNEEQDSISPILDRTRTSECVHETYGYGGGGTGSCWVRVLNPR